MKKLFLVLATIVSVSSFAEAAKVVITNNSDYALKVWTGKMPRLITGLGVEAGQKLVLDLPDNQVTTVKMYRCNMEAAGKNISGVVGRVMTAEAPSKSNGLAWLGAAYAFGGAVVKSSPIKMISVNPSQIVDGQVKNIIVTNYEHNDATIDATLEDADIVDFEDLAAILLGAPAPITLVESDQVSDAQELDESVVDEIQPEELD